MYDQLSYTVSHTRGMRCTACIEVSPILLTRRSSLSEGNARAVRVPYGSLCDIQNCVDGSSRNRPATTEDKKKRERAQCL